MQTDMVPGDKYIRQTYDLMLVVKTGTIVFFSGNKIKFSSAVLIFGSRSIVALIIVQEARSTLCLSIWNEQQYEE